MVQILADDGLLSAVLLPVGDIPAGTQEAVVEVGGVGFGVGLMVAAWGRSYRFICQSRRQSPATGPALRVLPAPAMPAAIAATIDAFTLAIELAVDSFAAAIQSLIDTIALAIELAIHSFTTAVEPLVDAIAFPVEPLCQALVSVFGGTFGTIIEPVVNTITAVIETLFNAVALVIETFLDTVAPIIKTFLDAVAPVVETLLDTVAGIGQGCTTHEQQSRHSNNGLFRIHVTSPHSLEISACSTLQRSNVTIVDTFPENES